MARKSAINEVSEYFRSTIQDRSGISATQTMRLVWTGAFHFRVAVFLICLLYSVVVAGATSPYAGVYNGEITGATDNGQFAHLVRTDGSSAVIYFDGFDEEGGFKDEIAIASDGSFSFQIPSDPFDTASGQIVGANITGSICCAEPGAFSGTKSSPTGFFQDYGGLYRGTIDGTSTEDGVTYQVAGEARAIIDASGSAMMYIFVTLSIGGQAVDSGGTGGRIAVNTANVVSGTLLDGVVINGDFTPATLTASGTFSFLDADSSASGEWTLTREEVLPPPDDMNEPDTKSVLPVLLPLLLNQE